MMPKNDTKNPKPVENRNITAKRGRRSRIVQALVTFASEENQRKARWAASVLKVSGKNSSTDTRLAAARRQANQKGVAAPNHGRIELSASLPPMNGPRMKPRPKAAPVRPNALERSSGLVTSATEALATAMLPPVRP